MESRLTIAKRALKNWVLGIESGDWGPYLAMLSDDYTLWLHQDERYGHTINIQEALAIKKEVNSLLLDIKALKRDADITYESGDSVIFEFLNVADNKGRFKNRCFALAFEIKNSRLNSCREYQCALLHF